jgi:hypothetical protein
MDISPQVKQVTVAVEKVYEGKFLIHNCPSSFLFYVDNEKDN